MQRPNSSLRVSMISGIVHTGDAISETILADLETLDRLARARRWNLDIRVYCASAVVEDSRVRVVKSWRDLLRQPHFQSSDLLVYHFGIYHELHDTLQFARRDASVVAFYHNITPPQYCRREAEKLLHQSFQQVEMLRVANVHLTASRFSARQLESYLGKPVEVVPLFGPNAAMVSPAVARSRVGAALNVLFCGRFTEGKGVSTLLEALAQLKGDSDRPVRAVLAGITDFSDEDYMRSLRVMAEHLPKSVAVRFMPNLTPTQLKDAYLKADVFVLPSFHEGFGMPVIEALSFATPIICSDAGALPEVTEGLALTFPAGDSAALAQRLEQFQEAHRREYIACDSGEFEREVWAQKALSRAALLSREAYIEKAGSRFGSWLQSIHSYSNGYRERLEARAAEIFGLPEAILNTEDAAVVGSMRALEVLDLLERDDVDKALAVILKWPFARDQSEADKSYWRTELKRLGFRGVVRRLASASEVRESPARLQIGATLQGLLSDVPIRQETQHPGNPFPHRLSIAHPNVALLLATNIPASEFVREAYRLVLRREPDPTGFGTRFLALNSGKITRKALLEEMMASAEYSVISATAVETGSTEEVRGSVEVVQLDPSHPKIAHLASGSGSNSDFLHAAYRLILTREADADGIRDYLPALEAGHLTRRALLEHLLASPERAALVAKSGQ